MVTKYRKLHSIMTALLGLAVLAFLAVLVCGTRTRAMAVNMGGAFGMLFLAMHTNGWLARVYKENPAAPGQGREARFALYSLLHDLNPCGQAAQLSVWEVRRPVRVLVLDIC
jgi:hypothetical protein